MHQNRKAKPNFFFQGVEIALLYFHRTGQTAKLGGQKLQQFINRSSQTIEKKSISREEIVAFSHPKNEKWLKSLVLSHSQVAKLNSSENDFSLGIYA